MTKGKIIVIEGTDCSGKETQSNLLLEHLRKDGIEVEKMSFPMYDTPTGRIVGGPFLGKSYIQEGFFPELASNVEAKVASLYYAADRRYNLPKIKELIDNGINVILDRYVESNMAHQGGKIESKEERIALYDWIDNLEFNMLELPRPDKVVLLYMPYQHAIELRKKRKEAPDQVESDITYLINSEKTYLELAEIYNFDKVECTENEKVLSIGTIHDRVYKSVKEII